MPRRIASVAACVRGATTPPPCSSRSLKENTETEALGATVCYRLAEALDYLAAVRLDHPSGCDVVSVGRQLNVRKAFVSCLRKQQLSSTGCVSPPALPRDHRVPNVAQTMGRELCCTRLPAKINGAEESYIPHPSRKPRQARNRGTVWKNHQWPFGVPVVLRRKKTIRILGDAREFVQCGLRSEIVR